MVFVVVMGLGGTAAAQEREVPDETVLETITVNARKIIEDITGVPFAVTAFPADALDEVGIEDTQSLARLVPGSILPTAASVFRARSTFAASARRRR